MKCTLTQRKGKENIRFPFSFLKTSQISPFFLGFVSFGELATTGLSTVLMVLAQV
jgi:hypothetical protein